MANPRSQPKRRKVKQPWHRGTYHVQSRKVTARAKADPSSTCWRCGLTLSQARAKYPTRRVHWTAGHLVTGQVGGQLAAECSPCNYGHGTRLRNLKARAKRLSPRRTDLTW